MTMEIAPSILASDFSKLGEEIERTSKAGADYIHIDVMDGMFVKNITIGPPVIKSIRKYTDIPFDVHLMIEEPSRYIDDFVKAGADIITIHLEAEKNIEKAINLIKSKGIKVGLSIKPNTPIDEIMKYLNLIDIVLIMTVEPGFGGQSFIEEMMEKVKTIKREIEKNKLNIKIEVDGGINQETIKIAKSAGVDICVAGTSVYKSSDMKTTINQMKQ